jgi:hypothetical protein
LQENLIHKDGATNEIEGYRAEFANTQSGWTISSQASDYPKWVWPAGEANNYIQIKSSSSLGTSNIQINLSKNIEGSAYDKFAIRYMVEDSGSTTSNTYQFKWRNKESATIHELPALGDDGFDVFGAWNEKYFDLSGQDDWIGKRIDYLKFDFAGGGSGEDVHQIDWIHISGNNHPHPYRYNAPPATGANGWNTNY